MGVMISWWQVPQALSRYVRDVLQQEMSQLRPSGWRWPSPKGPGQDVHLIDDAGADSLELLALSAAFCDALDLTTAQDLAHLHEHPTWQAWTSVASTRLERDDATVRFLSSGSTGRPRRVTHRLVDLEQEMQALLEVLAPSWSGDLRILCPVRSNHIYGFLFSSLLPVVAARTMGRLNGKPPQVVDLCGQPAASARAMAREGDLIVGFPDWWSAVHRAQVQGSRLWPEGVIGLCSTAPCPQTVALQALEVGLNRWVEIYGSSETAGVGWRDDPCGPFTLHEHWRRLGAIGVAEQRTDTGLQRRAPDGQWSEPIVLADHLQWLDDSRFVPLARRDGQVQVGGVNVDPAQVRQRLLTHPSVAQVAVRQHPTPTGMRLKAFVVPQRDLFEADPQATAAELREHLRAWCSRHLVPAARPFDIRIGAALPRNEMGKLADWEPGWQR